MFPKNIKIVLSLICIALSIFQFFESEIGNGIALIILALMFIFLYFKNEIILISFLKLRKQDFEGTLKWLNRIKNPKTALTTKQYGYYNFLHGLIESQKNWTKAEKFFKKAISLGLNMKHDLAMAKLSLAGILMHKRRKREATSLLSEAKNLHKQCMLSEQIKMMQKQMKRI